MSEQILHLKFRQLEAFRAVVTNKSTQSAANKLFITQPAISRLIKDLEIELGFSLFERTNGKLVLNAQGTQFFEALEHHFLGLERLAHAADNIRQNHMQKLVLACSPVLSTTFLPHCLKAILQTYPGLMVEIQTAELTSIRHLFQNGVIDIALSLAFPPPPGVMQQRLGQVDAVCAVPDEHPLRKKDHIKLSDLSGENIIDWLPISPFTGSLEQTLFEDNAIPLAGPLKTQSANTRYALIAAGLGVSITEPFTAHIWRKLGVTTRPIRPTVQFEYVLSYQQSLAKSDFFQSIFGIIGSSYLRFAEEFGSPQKPGGEGASRSPSLPVA